MQTLSCIFGTCNLLCIHRLRTFDPVVAYTQVGQKRPRQTTLADEYGMSADLQLDKDGNPRKKLRAGFPAHQFLTIYDHRDTQKQRWAFAVMQPKAGQLHRPVTALSCKHLHRAALLLVVCMACKLDRAVKHKLPICRHALQD